MTNAPGRAKILDTQVICRRHGSEGGRADGKAFAGCGGGVAERIKGIGALPHFRGQSAHLGIAARVVGDRAIGSRGQGDYRHPSSADTIPPDIPDGSDDDVVARQIREAAMAETDPELREKLWEEYRKYKKGN